MSQSLVHVFLNTVSSYYSYSPQSRRDRRENYYFVFVSIPSGQIQPIMPPASSWQLHPALKGLDLILFAFVHIPLLFSGAQ